MLNSEDTWQSNTHLNLPKPFDDILSSVSQPWDPLIWRWGIFHGIFFIKNNLKGEGPNEWTDYCLIDQFTIMSKELDQAIDIRIQCW